MSDDDEIQIRNPRQEPMSALDRLVFAKWAEFVAKLANRQGTRPLDFDELRRRKAEIDRQTLAREREAPDERELPDERST